MRSFLHPISSHRIGKGCGIWQAQCNLLFQDCAASQYRKSTTVCLATMAGCRIYQEIGWMGSALPFVELEALSALEGKGNFGGGVVELVSDVLDLIGCRS
jgi:hypothetical protein